MTWLLGFVSPRLWLTVIVLAVMAGSHFFVYRAGRAAVRAEWSAVTLQATQAARQTEANWQTDVQSLEEVHHDELRRIAADHVRDLARVRDRAARLPEASRAACNGSTGAELSGRDASAFVGLAARADAVRADLQACRAWIETVTKGNP